MEILVMGATGMIGSRVAAEGARRGHMLTAASRSGASVRGASSAMTRASSGSDWSMLSRAPAIAPGERTGAYEVGLDSPAGEAISAEDFAVAIVDELEKPAHAHARFTVANQAVPAA
jgi:putative NADH-flavin reductase